MMGTLKQVVIAMMSVGAVGLAEAHHADNSQFNANKLHAYTGALERMYLGNPHGYLYFVSVVNGQQQHWTFETDAILAMRRAGLSVRTDLVIGTTYSLVYSPALDGSQSGLIDALKLSDGRIIAFLTKDNVDASNKLLTQKLLNGTPNSQSQQ
jgi:hypothetical protein